MRLFYPMAPLTLTPPEDGEDCVWASRDEAGLSVLVREKGKSKTLTAPVPDGDTPRVCPGQPDL